MTWYKCEGSEGSTIFSDITHSGALISKVEFLCSDLQGFLACQCGFLTSTTPQLSLNLTTSWGSMMATWLLLAHIFQLDFNGIDVSVWSWEAIFTSEPASTECGLQCVSPSSPFGLITALYGSQKCTVLVSVNMDHGYLLLLLVAIWGTCWLSK